MTLIEKWKHRVMELKTETYAIFLAYKHPKTPWYARIFAGLVAAYAFSPIDLIPDFIPILGYLDDLILVPLGIRLALKMIPAEVMAECRIRSQEMLKNGKPTNWLVASLIILVWLVILFLVGYWVFRLFNQA